MRSRQSQGLARIGSSPAVNCGHQEISGSARGPLRVLVVTMAVLVLGWTAACSTPASEPEADSIPPARSELAGCAW